MECHRTPRCKSFNFASKTRQCQLNDATHLEFPQDLTNDSSTIGIMYYPKDAITISQDAVGPCGNHPCKNDGRCLDTISAVTGNRTYFCLCQNGWKGDVCDIEEDSLGWATWAEWSPCSTSCGNGYHVRQRKCKNLDSGADLSSSQCYGRDIEYKACQFRKCPMWEDWGTWGECTTLTTCGTGSRSRTRSCGNGGKPGIDRYCLGPVNETMACDGVPCNGMVRLKNGVKFGEGRVDIFNSHTKKWLQVCGENWNQKAADIACKQRGFLGAHIALTNGTYDKVDDLDVVTLECTGDESFLHQCRRVGADQCSVIAGVQCMVRGAWSLWTFWGGCSVTCENGTRTRTRVCNHPPPNFGGRKCPGDDLEFKPCTMKMCPGNGVWLSWEAWSACSASCDGGTISRQRHCDTSRGSCLGRAYQNETCNNVSCNVDGVFKEWSVWGNCDVTCGGGSQQRSRTCDGPLHGGKNCSGAWSETQDCNTQNCPEDGVWMTWSVWGDCSVTCGGGLQYRNRTCDGPRYGGAECEGADQEQQECGKNPCPIPGDWLSWSGWSRCSATCGTGIRWRTRECNTTSYGDLTAPCEGTSNGTEDCNIFPCRPLASTCSQLREWGMVESGMVQLKPERKDKWSGKPELQPVWLKCDMESEGGVGLTVIGHDRETRTRVFGFEGAGEYIAKLNYSISIDHVIAIIDASKYCKQYLRWECKGSVIHNPHQMDSWTTFWTNRSSEFSNYEIPSSYFAGAKPGSGNCACGDTGSCANASLPCNCDSNDLQWRSDEGYITYKDDLPILAFRAGDTGSASEDGYVTIGPVLAYGTLG